MGLKFRWLLLLTLHAGLWAAVSADVDVRPPFGDNMVLQRGMPIPVWGRAEPGESVRVQLGAARASTRADANGEWQVKLPAQEAGGPLSLEVQGQSSVTFDNVLIGDVWVCSGQSNMAFAVASSNNAAEEVAAARHPEIRLFTVASRVAQEPISEVQGWWVECSPRTVGSFSAVGYFFGRHLRQELEVPIGLIDSSWGGTPAESWTPREVLEADEDFRPILTRHEEALANFPLAAEQYEQKVKEWEEQVYFAEPPNAGLELGWAKPELDDSDWQEIDLPVIWERAGLNVDGVVWFRKEVTVPPAWSGRDLELSLGGIDDTDVTYWNGVEVGRTGTDVEGFWQVPRTYAVPGKLVKPGRAVIAIRAFDRWQNGGFGGAPEQMNVAVKGVGQDGTIPLAGAWRYKLGEHREQPTELPPRPAQPRGPDHPYSPAGLYNAMIHPLIPYGIKGAIWYQGESNAGRAYQYRKLFPAMIRSWRAGWGQGDFAFLFVQLANFMAVQQQPVERASWPELREAQLMALELPNTGMAVIIDIGDADDIHPRNKQDVGKRLALAALAVAYGRDLVCSGPIYDHMEVQGARAVLSFEHIGGGLVADGGPLKGFAVAGEGQKFVHAEAEIRGEKVVVWSKEVERPAAVRYGWANNPVCNLCNAEGLPASPFRTDNWPGATDGNR